MIWEYPVDELAVLCNTCHDEVHAEKDVLQGMLSKLSSIGVSDVISLLYGYCNRVQGPAHFDIDPAMDNFADYVNDPWCGMIGVIAAEISNRGRNIGVLSDLLKQLESVDYKDGGSINLVIPARNTTQPGGE